MISKNHPYRFHCSSRNFWSKESSREPLLQISRFIRVEHASESYHMKREAFIQNKTMLACSALWQMGKIKERPSWTTNHMKSLIKSLLIAIIIKLWSSEPPIYPRGGALREGLFWYSLRIHELLLLCFMTVNKNLCVLYFLWSPWTPGAQCGAPEQSSKYHVPLGVRSNNLQMRRSAGLSLTPSTPTWHPYFLLNTHSQSS